MSCRKILDNIESIMRKTEKVVISERKKPSKISDKDVLTKLKSYETLFKMLDATLSQMNIVNPTQVKIHEFENLKNEMMKLWRKLNISITTKAHLLKHHVRQQLQLFKGIGDKAEHHIEREHQVGSRLLALTRNIRGYEDRTHSQLKTMEIATNSAVKRKQKEVLLSTKRKRSADVRQSELKKREKVKIKIEERSILAKKDPA